ncbi:hypothetical protein P872_01070 [Rhodonellum psychrophilum GCM71 = DSM 17998]|uniref:Endonuclease/exonuclease/phosphatase domain-containing protein n=2 Tax=Rhodonellum TaxID=336827 RepID=U5C269_9BACT|nr:MULTISPECIES: endonuclease/exonuclease/phosphatase family protein [Rhodonellum]ERM83879.1 hypothetical protein P872_01070 [Rhodonellum psychrophilum GCM71 = DSM 17998]SDZ04252.1 Metal-dependent hydrolase, endonuclease/exonuclease/phosphatase family [Rhodonellum ikkaensis]
MKRSLVFFMSLSLVFAASAQDSSKEILLTVMSYNIYHGESAYSPGNSNIQKIAALINAVNPDFVALQEVDSMTNRTMGFNAGIKKDLMKELGELTGMSAYFAKAIDFSDGGYGEGLLSMFPAVFESHALPTPKGGEGRSLALAHVELPGGQKISFAGTHLCHEFEENRAAQTLAIGELLGNLPHPSILAGDLNFNPSEKPYSILSDQFLDAAEKFGNPSATYSSQDPKDRIDYVWLSKNSRWEIVEVRVIPVDYSDHFPIVVVVKLIL